MIKDKHCFVAVRERHHNVKTDGVFVHFVHLISTSSALLNSAGFHSTFLCITVKCFYVQVLTEESEAVADSTQFLKYKIWQP